MLRWPPVQVTLPFDEQNQLDRAPQAGGSGDGGKSYGVRLELPIFAHKGRWDVDEVMLVDKAGNFVLMTASDLEVWAGVCARVCAMDRTAHHIHPRGTINRLTRPCWCLAVGMVA